MNGAVKRSELKTLESDQEVRWCPGCGDYAILKAVQKALVENHAESENTVFISGIGCSSRFPYYMNTYGFHTIHGRAPAIATGLKIANPALDIWVVTGDGDGLSIGGNHLIHALRRNVDIQILLFNNEIYGLTKGQYSPTTKPNTLTPSSPRGSIDRPLHPGLLALGAGARFIARAIDTDSKNIQKTLIDARSHRGASFVEIFQNCIVYNDRTFAHFTDKKVAKDKQLFLEHGKAMTFGADNHLGIRLNPEKLSLESVEIGVAGVSEADLLVHDERNPVLAQLLLSMDGDQLPVALGTVYNNPSEGLIDSYHELLKDRKKLTGNQINALLRSGETWKIS